MGTKEVLGIVEQDSTWQYLSILITGRRLRRAACDVVEQRIRDRLEGWQSRSLFMMESVILVKINAQLYSCLPHDQHLLAKVFLDSA